jgi:hypothetical protein
LALLNERSTIGTFGYVKETYHSVARNEVHTPLEEHLAVWRDYILPLGGMTTVLQQCLAAWKKKKITRTLRFVEEK